MLWLSCVENISRWSDDSETLRKSFPVSFRGTLQKYCVPFLDYNYNRIK